MLNIDVSQFNPELSLNEGLTLAELGSFLIGSWWPGVCKDVCALEQPVPSN